MKFLNNGKTTLIIIILGITLGIIALLGYYNHKDNSYDWVRTLAKEKTIYVSIYKTENKNSFKEILDGKERKKLFTLLSPNNLLKHNDGIKFEENHRIISEKVVIDYTPQVEIRVYYNNKMFEYYLLNGADEALEQFFIDVRSKFE